MNNFLKKDFVWQFCERILLAKPISSCLGVMDRLSADSETNQRVLNVNTITFHRSACIY